METRLKRWSVGLICYRLKFTSAAHRHELFSGYAIVTKLCSKCNLFVKHDQGLAL